MKPIVRNPKSNDWAPIDPEFKNLQKKNRRNLCETKNSIHRCPVWRSCNAIIQLILHHRSLERSIKIIHAIWGNTQRHHWVLDGYHLIFLSNHRLKIYHKCHRSRRFRSRNCRIWSKLEVNFQVRTMKKRFLFWIILLIVKLQGICKAWLC